MTRLGFDGKYEFEDDEPIALDCGCTAYPGDGYERHLFKVGNDNVYRTCCYNKEDCTCNIFQEVMKKYNTLTYKGFTELECRTAEQEAGGYADDDQ